MSERGVTLFLEHLKGQGQFAYFQLGLCASAIAFAIHETEGESLHDTPWPLGVAVALWACSFAIGCRGVEARQAALSSNTKYLILLDEVGPYRTQPDIAAGIKQAERTIETAGERAMRRFKWQLWMLFGGAIFYIAGHLMGMAAIPTHQFASADSDRAGNGQLHHVAFASGEISSSRH